MATLAQKGSAKDGPTFCWHCNKKLHHAPGKGLGLFYFQHVVGPDGIKRRVHDACVRLAVAEGAKHAG